MEGNHRNRNTFVYVLSTFRKPRVMNKCAQLAFSFLSSLISCPRKTITHIYFESFSTSNNQIQKLPHGHTQRLPSMVIQNLVKLAIQLSTAHIKHSIHTKPVTEALTMCYSARFTMKKSRGSSCKRIRERQPCSIQDMDAVLKYVYCLFLSIHEIKPITRSNMGKKGFISA